MIPPETTVSIYGTYSKYVYLGGYICKIFEYNEQCNRNEQGLDCKYGKYTYIGDRYKELYPYKSFKLDGDVLRYDSTVTYEDPAEGGARRKYKTYRRNRRGRIHKKTKSKSQRGKV